LSDLCERPSDAPLPLRLARPNNSLLDYRLYGEQRAGSTLISRTNVDKRGGIGEAISVPGMRSQWRLDGL
jgi:hypothetical protein